MVNMVPVSSSNITAVGHDPVTKDLHVTFNSGTTYVYHDVDAEKHAALMASDSKGTHLNKHIKSAHEWSKVEKPPA